MKAAIGNKHQVVIKIVKQLDDLMIRDPSISPVSIENSFEEDLDPFEIPMPSCALMDMGVSVSVTGGIGGERLVEKKEEKYA